MSSAATAPAFDAFISYHSGDAAWVATLKSALESHGVHVWIDSEQLRPGDLYPSALGAAINSVGSVILVLSRGSLASAWVHEEYTLALARQRRVVAVLIDDVEPPGFLAGRSYVDGRDPSGFERTVNDIVFGVTGRRPPEGDAPATAPFRDAAVDASESDEVTVLRRFIDRKRVNERRLRQARVMAGGFGVALGGAFFVGVTGASLELRALYLVLGVSAPSLAAWGVTAKPLSALQTTLEPFQLMCDSLEACRARSNPHCARLRAHFWDMMDRNARKAGVDFEQVTR